MRQAAVTDCDIWIARQVVLLIPIESHEIFN